MTDLYLHVGLPKTGTTTIQYFLGHNREVLEAHGVCFPDLELQFFRVNPYRNGRFLSVAYVDESGKKTKSRPHADYESILDKLGKCAKHYNKLVLSDESIWSYRAGQPVFWQNLKDDLAERNIDLHFVVYVRRQDSFVQSLYREKIKRSDIDQTFHEYLDWLKKHKYPLDYATYMDMLSAILPKENIHIRVFERGQFQGEEHTLLSDFLEVIGLSLKDGFEVLPDENMSVDGTYLKMQYYLNTLSEAPHLSPALRKSFFDVQTQNSFVQNIAPTTLFNEGEQVAFLESFAESNKRLAKQYLGREDERLFLDSEVKELPHYQIETEDLLRDTIIYYGRAVQVLEKQNEQLHKEYLANTKEMFDELTSYYNSELQKLQEQNQRLKESLDKQVKTVLRKEIENMKNKSSMYQWLKKCYSLKNKFKKN